MHVAMEKFCGCVAGNFTPHLCAEYTWKVEAAHTSDNTCRSTSSGDVTVVAVVGAVIVVTGVVGRD